MATRSGGFYGTAIGVDSSGAQRRISVFEDKLGFRFVDENLEDHRHRAQSADQICGDVAALFGLRNVRLEMPRLGIYSTAAKPVSKPEAARPDTWGSVLKAKKPGR
jgi:hypothetical protein